MITDVDHLVVSVIDLQRASDEYTALLGREPSWFGEHPMLGTRNVLYRLGNTYIELISAENPSSHPLTSIGQGLVAIAFGTDDIDGEFSRLSETMGVTPPVDGLGQSSEGVERRWRTSMIDIGRSRGVFAFLIQHLSPPELLPSARAVDIESGGICLGVDHVVIATSDTDAALNVYRDHLGLDLRLDRVFEDWGVRLAFFRIGGLTLELAERRGDGAADLDRLWGISYWVDSVEAAHRRLVETGVSVSDIREGRRPGTRVFTVNSHTLGVATLMIGQESA